VRDTVFLVSPPIPLTPFGEQKLWEGLLIATVCESWPGRSASVFEADGFVGADPSAEGGTLDDGERPSLAVSHHESPVLCRLNRPRLYPLQALKNQYGAPSFS
jgi:hypothetical protein